MKIELFKSTPHGIRYWAIEPDYDGATIEITHGVYKGTHQYKTEYVEENQSGRDIDEQIDLVINSRVKSKKDIGYRDSIEEAKSAEGANTLGYYRPMLAKRLDKMKNIDYSRMYLQMKYDGHRCLVTRTNSGLIAYSRNGRRITTIDHILSGIQLPIGCTIDGELYCHGVPLQTITSWCKRQQPNTLRLEYIVYDIIQNEGYRYRYNVIKNLVLGDNARIAPTDKTAEESNIPIMLENAIALGYEGVILRQLDMSYEPGKRSSGLIKVKQFMDEEFKVVGVSPSSDGWAILKCITNDGVNFDVSAPGTISDKFNTMANSSTVINKYVTVKFANWTNAGKPFHPVATEWREDL